jgi:hypothetical protein
MQYVLNVDHSVEPMDDPVEFMRRYELDDRVVAAQTVGRVTVLTTFTGIAHGHSVTGQPLLFETMVLKGPLDGRTWRWASYRDAQDGHKRVLAQVIDAEAQAASSSSSSS